MVTIVGKEFGRIENVRLDRMRCSWGDPRPWQQSVFAAQQADMDGWTAEESVLPSVPSTYFTNAARLTSDVTVNAALKATFGLPDDLKKVDLLECPSHPRDSGDVSLWFSLRFEETVRRMQSAQHALPRIASTHARTRFLTLMPTSMRVQHTQAPTTTQSSRVEPNLMDTGFTFMYYPAPSNFSNAAITGGPVVGGTSVVIDGTGFTRGYRSEDDIDLANLIARCKFTDKPSVVAFRSCPPDAASLFPFSTPLNIMFDVPTNGVQLATEPTSGVTQLLTGAQVDELFTFYDGHGHGGPIRLAEVYVGKWVDDRTLTLYASNPSAAVDTDAAEAAAARISGGSGVTLSLRHGQTMLRKKGRCVCAARTAAYACRARPLTCMCMCIFLTLVARSPSLPSCIL